MIKYRMEPHCAILGPFHQFWVLKYVHMVQGEQYAVQALVYGSCEPPIQSASLYVNNIEDQPLIQFNIIRALLAGPDYDVAW
jgi:hypothetical protein